MHQFLHTMNYTGALFLNVNAYQVQLTVLWFPRTLWQLLPIADCSLVPEYVYCHFFLFKYPFLCPCIWDTSAVYTAHLIYFYLLCMWLCNC